MTIKSDKLKTKKIRIKKWLNRNDKLIRKKEVIKKRISWNDSISLIKQKVYDEYDMIKEVDENEWKQLHKSNCEEEVKCVKGCYLCKKLVINEIDGLLTKKQKKQVQLKIDKADNWVRINNMSKIKYLKQPIKDIVKKDCKECDLCDIPTTSNKRVVDNLVPCNNCDEVRHYWEVSHGRYKDKTIYPYFSNLICLRCFCDIYTIIESNLNLLKTSNFNIIYVLFKIGVLIISDLKYKVVYKVTLDELLKCPYNYNWVLNGKSMYIY